MRRTAGYTYVWAFQVRPDQQTAFERIYGPEGDWVALFRQAQGFISTHLLKDNADPHRYVTIDRWQSEAAYREFRDRFEHQYRALDEKCQDLTVHEQSLGAFTEISHEDQSPDVDPGY